MPLFFKNKEEIVCHFTETLYVLLKGKVPLTEALKSIAFQTKDKKFRSIVLDIKEKILSGSSFSSALYKHAYFFDLLYINLIKSAEQSGNLIDTLGHILSIKKNKLHFKKKAYTLMLYPKLVFFLSILIVLSLFFFVIPRFEFIYRDLLPSEKSLPKLTLIVMNFSNYLKFYPLKFISLLFGSALFVKLVLRFKLVHSFLDRLSLRIPLLSSVVLKFNLILFSFTFSSLLKNGVPILQALNITQSVVPNSVIRKSIFHASRLLYKGHSFAVALEAQKIFPQTVISLVQVGEQTSQMPELLSQIAATAQKDLEISFERILAFLEPLFVLFLTVIIGLFVIALFLPLISLIDALSVF